MTPAERLSRELRRQRLRKGLIAAAIVLVAGGVFAALEPSLQAAEFDTVARIHERPGGRTPQVWATRPDGGTAVVVGLRPGETPEIGQIVCTHPIRRLVPYRVTLAVTDREECLGTPRI